jgi:hypothetical protein
MAALLRQTKEVYQMAEKRKFYGMRNDYMFHAVLQKNEEVLRNLLATLLEIDEAEIESCHIENPIELGKEIEGKECILDVKLTLNNDKVINIELQVYKQTHWISRSLLYWARAYDNLKSGQGYDMLLPAYHIGILDFTLFEDHTKFMAQYQILDVEDGYLYSDKLCIKVLDLTQLEKAKQEPETNKKLLKWAGIFKAETLEELEQLARGEEVFENMVVTMKKLSEDEKIRMQCEAREDYERCLLTEYNAGKREGIELERENTEKERQRADDAVQRADDAVQRANDAVKRAAELEAEVKRLQELLQ